MAFRISVPEHPLRRAAEADQRALILEIERSTGLDSRWNGLIWVRGADYPQAGQKHRWSGISIREDVLLHKSRRWRTMIHEGLHSVSSAFSRGRLDPRNQAWEEAIAEQLQRLLRQSLLRSVRVPVQETEFEPDDLVHAYNGHIRTLERYRQELSKDMRAFYVELLTAVSLRVDRVEAPPSWSGAIIWAENRCRATVDERAGVIISAIRARDE